MLSLAGGPGDEMPLYRLSRRTDTAQSGESEDWQPYFRNLLDVCSKIGTIGLGWLIYLLS